ncbi:MAG TPA: PQQ-binding-like beta-propeller repeat protein, partial [Gemmataceae bacterium]|nr:PQQ-binding-like beta-propeller repeat protein [Gemmataceae bacterium]
EGQWSNPVYADVNGKPQIIFPGGDGYLYGLEPKTGKMIWKFKCNPPQTDDDRGIPAYFIGTPVVYENRVYIGLGAYPDHSSPPKIGHFFCVDVTKTGDVSCKNENLDPKDPANKDSALVWHIGGMVKPAPKKGRKVQFGATSSTAAIHDGLVYIAEQHGYLQCLDAKTGQRYWEHDFKAAVFGSAYWVNGKIYVCAKDTQCHIFEHGKEYQPPRSVEVDDSSDSAPVVANGVLYILSPSKLWAIGAK